MAQRQRESLDPHLLATYQAAISVGRDGQVLIDPRVRAHFATLPAEVQRELYARAGVRERGALHATPSIFSGSVIDYASVSTTPYRARPSTAAPGLSAVTTGQYIPFAGQSAVTARPDPTGTFSEDPCSTSAVQPPAATSSRFSGHQTAQSLASASSYRTERKSGLAPSSISSANAPPLAQNRDLIVKLAVRLQALGRSESEAKEAAIRLVTEGHDEIIARILGVATAASSTREQVLRPAVADDGDRRESPRDFDTTDALFRDPDLAAKLTARLRATDLSEAEVKIRVTQLLSGGFESTVAKILGSRTTQPAQWPTIAMETDLTARLQAYFRARGYPDEDRAREVIAGLISSRNFDAIARLLERSTVSEVEQQRVRTSETRSRPSKQSQPAPGRQSADRRRPATKQKPEVTDTPDTIAELTDKLSRIDVAGGKQEPLEERLSNTSPVTSQVGSDHADMLSESTSDTSLRDTPTKTDAEHRDAPEELNRHADARTTIGPLNKTTTFHDESESKEQTLSTPTRAADSLLYSEHLLPRFSLSSRSTNDINRASGERLGLGLSIERDELLRSGQIQPGSSAVGRNYGLPPQHPSQSASSPGVPGTPSITSSSPPPPGPPPGPPSPPAPGGSSDPNHTGLPSPGRGPPSSQSSLGSDPPPESGGSSRAGNAFYPDPGRNSPSSSGPKLFYCPYHFDLNHNCAYKGRLNELM